MDTRKRKRSSILKKPGSIESSPTQTFSKINCKRISFSGKNNVKEFTTGVDKETIWGSSYEESAENILQSTNQTSSIEQSVPQDENSIKCKYNLRNSRSSVVQAPIVPNVIKKLNVFKEIQANTSSVDMNISIEKPKKSSRTTQHFTDEDAELDISQKVLTAIDKKKLRKTINFINGEEIAEEIVKSKMEIEGEQPPSKISKIDQNFSYSLHEEADANYTFINSDEFEYTRQSFLNRSIMTRSQCENSLRKSVILKSPKKLSIGEPLDQVSESDKENFISLNLETCVEVPKDRQSVYTSQDMNLTVEPNRSLGAIPKKSNRQTILQSECMDETKIGFSQSQSEDEASVPTEKVLGPVKKIPSVFNTISKPKQNLCETLYQPLDMVESDDDVFEDAECLDEKSNLKSIYVTDMELCSPTENKIEEKRITPVKSRRSIYAHVEMEMMSPVTSFQDNEVSQDASANIILLENLMNDRRHSLATTSNQTPETSDPNSENPNKSRRSLTHREIAAQYCKEHNLDGSSSSDSNEIKMKLTDVNIKRRSIITTSMDITPTDDLNQTSMKPNRKSIHTRISMNITLASDLEQLDLTDELKVPGPSNNRKSVYAAAPMNLTLAVNQNTAEPVDITLAVSHNEMEDHNSSDRMDESERNENIQKDKRKTIILEESMNLCEDSNEIIPEDFKRKTIYVNETMNVTEGPNEQKSCIKLSKAKRNTIHAHEEMNMTGVENVVDESDSLDVRPMIVNQTSEMVKEKPLSGKVTIFENFEPELIVPVERPSVIQLQDMNVSSTVMEDSIRIEKQEEPTRTQPTSTKTRQTIIFPENEEIEESYQENLTENTAGISLPRHAISRHNRTTDMSLHMPDMTYEELIKHRMTSTAIHNVTFNPDSRDATDVIFSVAKDSNLSVPNNFAGIFNKLQNTNSITMQSGTDSAFSPNTTEALCSKKIQTIVETPIKSRIPRPITPNIRALNKTTIRESLSSRNLSEKFEKETEIVLNETCSCSPRAIKNDASYKREFIDLTIGRLSDSMLRSSSSSSSNDIDKTEMNLIQSTFESTNESIQVVQNEKNECTTCQNCNKKFILPVYTKHEVVQDLELLKANIDINCAFRNLFDDFFIRMAKPKKKKNPVPEPVMFPSIPSITFLSRNAIDTKSEALILESTTESYIGAFLPEIPIFDVLMKNKIESTGWNLCRLLFSYGLIELTHPKLPGIQFKICIELDKNGRVGRRNNKYNFKNVLFRLNTKRVFMSSAILIHSEFIKTMPNDLLLSCPSTDQIFDFVDLLNSNYLKSYEETTSLIEIVESNKAMLIHDGNFNIFIKKIVVSVAKLKVYEIVIDINRISEIGEGNIFIQPHVEFSKSIKDLAVGLPFLNKFLSNVKIYFNF